MWYKNQVASCAMCHQQYWLLFRSGFLRQSKLLRRIKIYFRLLILIGFLGKGPAGGLLPRCFPQNHSLWRLLPECRIPTEKPHGWLLRSFLVSALCQACCCNHQLKLYHTLSITLVLTNQNCQFQVLNLKFQCNKIASERIVINSKGATWGQRVILVTTQTSPGECGLCS